MSARERVTEAFRSLRERPIPLFDQETLEAGLDFFKRHMALALPAYLLAATQTITGRRLNQLIPAALEWVLVPALLAFIMWTIGTADRWRRGQPRFTAPAEIASTIKSGLSIWWRAFIVFIRFILLFLVVGFIAGAMRMSQGAATFLSLVLWVLTMIPSWGFAVRFWDRTKELAGAGRPVPEPVPSPPVSSRSGMAIVAGAWVVAAAVLGPPIVSRASNRASSPAVAVTDATECRSVALSTTALSPTGRYEVRVSADSSGESVIGRETTAARGIAGGVDGAGGATSVRPEWTIVPATPFRHVGVAFGAMDDMVYLVREDSVGTRTLLSVPLLGRGESIITYDSVYNVALAEGGAAIIVSIFGNVLSCAGVSRR